MILQNWFGLIQLLSMAESHVFLYELSQRSKMIINAYKDIGKSTLKRQQDSDCPDKASGTSSTLFHLEWKTA